MKTTTKFAEFLGLAWFWVGLMPLLAVADEPVELEVEPGFGHLPRKAVLGQCSAVSVNSAGEIYLFHRGKHPIICLDAEGKFLRWWGDNLIGTAHGLRIDRDDNIWVTDVARHRVLKFDPKGKILLSLGTGKPGAGADQFNQPTDIAFGAEGVIYISDGYGNSRVMKFGPEGRLLGTWGTPGKGDGEFNLPHSIILDSQGRVLVGDRENDRIQIFDSEGKLLEIWKGYAPYGMAFDPDGRLFVADGRAAKILRLDSAGQVQQSWGSLGKAPGQFDMPHMLGFNAAGDLYVAEVNGMRLQKFGRKR